MIEEQRKLQIEVLKRTLRDLLSPGSFEMVLFGSRARGDYSDESDLDIAIIVKGLTRAMKMLILEKVAESELQYLLPVSALILSKEEFEHLKNRERRIALDIEKEGIPL
ncbi:MAG: nucleotidyltransferase domain-containing protein [Desulfobacteraceae bacterium]|nr:MAG: nucleotidyltransferase domain-containing protein [Desulfobacteraceae bacterium]